VSQRPWPPSSEVRLITVDAPLDSSLWRGASPSAYDDLVSQQRAAAIRHLNDAAVALKKQLPGLIVTPLFREGWPKEVILDEAERWGADLIVVGSRGHGTIKRLFLGSVSLAVATNAPCSVEIVRAPTASVALTIDQ